VKVLGLKSHPMLKMISVYWAQFCKQNQREWPSKQKIYWKSLRDSSSPVEYWVSLFKFSVY